MLAIFISRMLKGLFLISLLVAGPTQAKDLPGSSPTSWGVSQGGAFQFQIPIVVPAGRNGVQPNLSIAYSSGGANGSMGMGWGLSGLGAITRCGPTFATNGQRVGVTHGPTDRFCLNGQQLILVYGTYGAASSVYRTEIDQISKIVANGSNTASVNGGTVPNSFTVFRKDGSKWNMGLTAASRFYLPGTSSIHAWKLGKVRDKDANYYEISYRSDDGLPDVINYTAHSNMAANKQVRFVYGGNSATSTQRTDKRTRYIAGRAIEFDQLLREIKVEKDGIVVREYRMDYEIAPTSGNSRLTEVKECGLYNSCHAPIDIQWAAETPGYQTFGNILSAADFVPHAMYDNNSLRQHFADGQTMFNNSICNGGANGCWAMSKREQNYGTWADLNGDGELDQVISVIKADGTLLEKVYLKDKASGGWSDQTVNWKLPRPLRNYDDNLVNHQNGRFLASVANQGQFADVDGDGLVDVVYAYTYYSDHAQSTNLVSVKETHLNTGSGWQLSSAYQPKGHIYDYVVNAGPDNRRVETIRARLVDLNGDGLADWVEAFYDYISSSSPGVENRTTWLNNGNGWDSAASANYKLPDVFAEHKSDNSPLPHGEFVDVNGDGLLDWVQAYQEHSQSLTSNTWLNGPTGFSVTPNSIYRLPEPIYDNLSGWGERMPFKRGSFVDVNGDGLRDYVRSYKRNSTAEYQSVRINTGRGWTNNTSYDPPFIHLDFTYTDSGRSWPSRTGGFYIDLNRDGLIDYIQAYKDHAGIDHYGTWLNDGSNWVAEPTSSPHYAAGLFFEYTARAAGVLRHALPLDINNDGATDFVGNGLNSRVNNLVRADQIQTITTTMGVQVQPLYEALTNSDQIYQKGTGATVADARHLEAPMYVVSELRSSSADGSGWNTTSYQYGGLQVHRLGRGFLGFKTRTITDDKGISNHQEYRQDYPYIGRLKSQQSMLNGQLLSETNNILWTHTIDHGAAGGIQTLIPYVRISRTVNYEDGVQYRNTYQRTTIDDYGNATEVLTRVGLGTLTNIDFDRQTRITNVYQAPNLVTWKVNLVSDTTSLTHIKNSPALTRHSQFVYDGRGRMIHSYREPNNTVDDSVRLRTMYFYDTFGNVTKERTTEYHPLETSRDTNIAYDARFRLPVSLGNAIGQTVATIIYDPICDQPDTVTDINGVVTASTYDNFCRAITETIQATATTVALGNTITYDTVGLSCSNCQTSPKLKTTLTTTGQQPVYVYSNLYGQTMKAVTDGMLGNEISQLTEYDTFGRTKKESQPFFASDIVYWNIHSYDELDRLTQTELPFAGNGSGNATISQDYTVNAQLLLEQVTTNTLGNNKTTVANTLGQVAEVRDAMSESMAYLYDAHGNLVRTTDALGNQINVIYDSIGRRIELRDPDLGTSQYTYNGYGDLLTQKDAKGQTISMVYDKLSRLTERDVPGTPLQSGGISTFTYHKVTGGVAPKGIGQLASISGPNGAVKTFTYDDLGRPASDTTTIHGNQYTQSYGYNDFGQLASRVYPSSGVDSNGNPQTFGLYYQYSNGFLHHIRNGPYPVDSEILWQANEYDALGRGIDETLGDVVDTTRTFKPGQGVLQKIDSVQQGASGVTLQKLRYNYDANSNLSDRSDQVRDTTETFIYDSLDRLTDYTRNDLNGSTSTAVRYNEIGNITFKSDVGDYSYHASKPHALLRVSSLLLPGGGDPAIGASTPFSKFEVNWEWDGQTILKQQPSIHDQDFVYDANGNVQVSGNREFDWTAFDKPVQMRSIKADGSQYGSRFEYSAGFERIVKEEGNYNSLGQLQEITETTHYVGKDYQRITDHSQSPAKVTHRYSIAVGSNSIQIDRDDNTDQDQISYILTDALGSTNVIVDAQGNETQRLAFDPWGMRTATDDPSNVNGITNRGYTGHEMDDEIGVINMNARIYDPYLGRFLSADPVLPDAYDMQSFNRYSYVLGNPLKYVDPTGNNEETVGQNPSFDCDGIAGCEEVVDIDPYDACARTYLDCTIIEGHRIPPEDIDPFGVELDFDSSRGGVRGNSDDAHQSYGCATGCPAHPSGNPNGPSNNGAGHRACVRSGVCATPPRLGGSGSNDPPGPGPGAGAPPPGSGAPGGGAPGGSGGQNSLSDNRGGGRFIPPTPPQGLVNAVAGFGDGIVAAISFGYGSLGNVRNGLGISGGIDISSSNYQGGFLAGGITGGATLGGLVGVLGKGVKGFEYSHFVPQRFLGRVGITRAWRSPLNGVYVPRAYHALTDKFRFRFMPRIWKQSLPFTIPQGIQQGLRVPPIYIGGAIGATVEPGG